jgi:hypothetical protein
MTGMEDWNRTTFDAAEKRLVCEPFDVMWIYNPADHIDEMRSLSHEEAMYLSIHSLMSIDVADSKFVPYYDVLVSLPGWEKSAGACLEREVAVACGIEVCELSEVVE